MHRHQPTYVLKSARSGIRQRLHAFCMSACAALLIALSLPLAAEAAVVRASSAAPAKVELARRVASVLEKLLNTNAIQFDGEIRLVTDSGFHAEAFFGKPGFVKLGENYAQSLSDGELTFVLAHELVHLLTDHGDRIRQFYANEVSAGIVNAADIHHLLEAEADRMGMQWATRAGASPEQAVSALKRAYGSSSATFTTHPALNTRAAALLAFK